MTGRQSMVFLAEAESEAPNRNPDASRTTPGPLIFVVSGEASGDNLAGSLMQALKAKTAGRVRFAGVGGPQSERQGLQSLFPMRELSVMGLAEVLPHLPRLIKRLNQTVAAARQLEPDAIVTVDSPGFCLRLAHHLRGSGIPIIHYVAPQLWAWRPGRARSSRSGSITSWRCCRSRSPSSPNTALLAPMSATPRSNRAWSAATAKVSERAMACRKT